MELNGRAPGVGTEAKREAAAATRRGSDPYWVPGAWNR